MKPLKIKDFFDAQVEVRGFINDKYPRVKRIDFGRVWKEKGVWTVEGEITLKTGLFSTINRVFRLRVRAETGEVTEYSEGSLQACMLKKGSEAL